MTLNETIALILGFVGMALSLSSIPISLRLRKNAVRPIDEVLEVLAQGRSRRQHLRVSIVDANGHALVSEAEVTPDEASSVLHDLARHRVAGYPGS